jgi:hypothetical protein
MNMQKMGGIAALYEAAVYVLGMVFSGCPGVSALRALESRLTSNNADSDRHWAYLGLRGHC